MECFQIPTSLVVLRDHFNKRTCLNDKGAQIRHHGLWNPQMVFTLVMIRQYTPYCYDVKLSYPNLKLD